MCLRYTIIIEGFMFYITLWIEHHYYILTIHILILARLFIAILILVCYTRLACADQAKHYRRRRNKFNFVPRVISTIEIIKFK